MAGADRGICRFGADRLGPRVRAFEREIGCVRAGADPECLHRLRVASRRLRTALPLFAPCFPEKRFRRWLRGIRAVTRALGNARDTDVQLAFLELYERTRAGTAAVPAGIGRIRAILRERRRLEQETILASLAAIGEKDLIPRLSAAIGNAGRSGRRRDPAGDPGRELSRFSAARIGERLDALLSLDAVVRDPDDAGGHHALRIAVKKLRYTLEVFRPLSPDRFGPALRGIRQLQELLGEIHDCDVWIRFLSTFPGERDEGGGGAGTRHDEGTGISDLRADRIRHRQERYRQLVREWEGCRSTLFWDRLREAAAPAPEAPGPARTLPPPATGSPVPDDGELGALARLWPEGAGHARQVTRLALMLFDELADLHRYGNRERRLLGYAGRLHDIGWEHGQKGHHARSCRMILADRTLPVTERERTVIALAARYHRKAFPAAPGGLFRKLRPKDRQRVLVLSALLRIADGLDYTHGCCVSSLSCSVTPETVTCVPVYDGNGATERLRALGKADLFEQVFSRRFEIP